jgi:hypothetical protein
MRRRRGTADTFREVPLDPMQIARKSFMGAHQ